MSGKCNICGFAKALSYDPACSDCLARIAAAESAVVEAAEAWAANDAKADTEALCERLYEAVFALRKARDSSTPSSEGKP